MKLVSFSTLVLVLQVAMLALFLGLYDYDHGNFSAAEYSIFSDIMVMLLLGFGYLMTFLKSYGLGAVGLTMFLTVLAMELNLFMEPLARAIYKQDVGTPLQLSVARLLDAEFYAATVLISFGAIIGRATPLQLVIMTVFESFFYAINKVALVFGVIGAEDVGGTLTIHMFGAYFGLAVAKTYAAPDSADKAESSHVSDVFSLIGTTLLWIYWPSFVGATETGESENFHLCVLHTILSLIGSTVATFGLSHLLHFKFDPVLIANSTLAGGVAIGASARLEMTPCGSLLVGLFAGVVSVLGFEYVGPFMVTQFQIYDTCGVHNLHGLPSLVGGLSSAIFVTLNPDAEFLLHEKGSQASHQVAAVAATVAIAIVSGWLTGQIMMLVDRERVYDDEYSDTAWWQTDYFDNAIVNADVSMHSIRSVRSVRSLNRSGHAKVDVNKVLEDVDDGMPVNKISAMEIVVAKAEPAV